MTSLYSFGTYRVQNGQKEPWCNCLWAGNANDGKGYAEDKVATNYSHCNHKEPAYMARCTEMEDLIN